MLVGAQEDRAVDDGRRGLRLAVQLVGRQDLEFRSGRQNRRRARGVEAIDASLGIHRRGPELAAQAFLPMTKGLFRLWMPVIDFLVLFVLSPCRLSGNNYFFDNLSTVAILKLSRLCMAFLWRVRGNFLLSSSIKLALF